MPEAQNIKIAIIMGSDSDLPVMKEAVDIFNQMNISFELTIVSAHRTPQRMFEYATSAKKRGIKLIIAGAGGAAHLPGMVASLTTLPVIGVPIKSSNSIEGWDSILSILQMPSGVPVATVALNGAKNAALLSLKILSISNVEIEKKLIQFTDNQKQKINTKIKELKDYYLNNYD